MSNLSEIKENIEEVKQSQENAHQLAIKVLEQNYKRERFINKCFLSIIGALLIINGYFAYQFTNTTEMTTTETTTEQSGMYNFYDSEGNMISSDLSLEEMQELIDLNQEAE